MTEPSHAVFLSYASQDAEAAQRICEALRAAASRFGSIRASCGAGTPGTSRSASKSRPAPCSSRSSRTTRTIASRGISASSGSSAVDRSHLISGDHAFLLPIVIDDTRDDDERVPERFREVQWTRLPGGVTPAAFVERVRRLLSGEPAQESTRPPRPAHASAATAIRKPVLPFWRSKAALLPHCACSCTRTRLLRGQPTRTLEAWRGGRSSAAFAPPPHSVAVLPFVNLSGDKEQEYFSDGLTEELLNSLAADQRTAGRRPHLGVLVQGQRQRHRHHRAETERRRHPRRQRAALHAYPSRHRSAHQCRHGLSPVVKDL